MSKQSKFLKVHGKAYWACVHRPNELSGKYQVDIALTDNKLINELKELGLNVKESNDERGNYITAKSNFPIKVVDSAVNAIPDTVLIGNGSKIIASIKAYPYNFKGREGVGAGLQGLQVVELVEYGNSDSDFMPTDGFRVTNTAGAVSDDDIEFGD